MVAGRLVHARKHDLPAAPGGWMSVGRGPLSRRRLRARGGLLRVIAAGLAILSGTLLSATLPAAPAMAQIGQGIGKLSVPDPKKGGNMLLEADQLVYDYD